MNAVIFAVSYTLVAALVLAWFYRDWRRDGCWKLKSKDLGDALTLAILWPVFLACLAYQWAEDAILSDLNTEAKREREAAKARQAARDKAEREYEEFLTHTPPNSRR